ncbi:hypothetical protein SBDP1_1160018 [Syntrophobacter sp. SbD1]|nr:hypothetical protein SBDP1_1160018 [Syntrophobacter sp. SbD1]
MAVDFKPDGLPCSTNGFQFRLSLLQTRESYRKGGSLVLLGFEVYPAAMLVDYLPGYHQSEAGSLAALSAEEAPECFCAGLFVHAAAIVLGLVGHAPCGFFNGPDDHFPWCVAPGRTGFYCVLRRQLCMPSGSR